MKGILQVDVSVAMSKKNEGCIFFYEKIQLKTLLKTPIINISTKYE